MVLLLKPRPQRAASTAPNTAAHGSPIFTSPHHRDQKQQQQQEQRLRAQLQQQAPIPLDSPSETTPAMDWSLKSLGHPTAAAISQQSNLKPLEQPAAEQPAVVLEPAPVLVLQPSSAAD